jgi:hypothetical protein
MIREQWKTWTRPQTYWERHSKHSLQLASFTRLLQDIKLPIEICFVFVFVV